MGRKYADDARRPSVWDVDALRRSMDALQVSWSHSVHLLGYLARHPEVAAWDDVAWGDLRSSPPRRFKEAVAANFSARSVDLVSRHDSSDGSTSKLVVGLRCGKKVETVVMRHGTLRSSRVTVCVSSQVGCAMRCSFCATGTMGMQGDLTRGEIVEQVLLAKGVDGRLRNVVFMGMGEPLHNIDAVLAAVDVLLDDRGLGFSKNKVTVSTSGLVPEIERYLAESQGSLAVSLNATTDEIRSWIMPINRKYNLERLLGALRANFPRRDGGRHQREVFFEYIMLEGVNDSAEDADRLVAIARTLPCKFNLIYFNTHDGSEFRCSDRETILAFRDRVVASGVTCTIRQSRGDEEAAACGQLGSPDAMEDWKPSPPRMKRPKRLREMEMEAQ